MLGLGQRTNLSPFNLGPRFPLDPELPLEHPELIEQLETWRLNTKSRGGALHGNARKLLLCPKHLQT